MNEKLSRADIINYLIAICVKNNITPKDVRFAGLIRKVCASKFGYDKYKAKSFMEVLISAWRFNKWKNYVENSHYLTEEEKRKWVQEHA
jgi:hypothetical protein